MKLYMFRTVPLSIIRSFSLYAQQWYMSQAVSKPVWHIPLLCVQWKTSDDGQKNCPKHVEFHFKNKFEKSVHLVSFVIRNLSRCAVTWKSSIRDILLSFPLPLLKGKWRVLPPQLLKGGNNIVWEGQTTADVSLNSKEEFPV